MVSHYDVFRFFVFKQEHFNISDAFIRKYQQMGGGYIDYALKVGHEICRYHCEPNQKWHLYEAYFNDKLFNNEGNFEFKNKSGRRVSITSDTFKCPELLLWMAEAAGVEESIINEAAGYAAEKIDDMRKNSPGKAYSSIAARHMNAMCKKNETKTFWDFIEEKINPQEKADQMTTD